MTDLREELYLIPPVDDDYPDFSLPGEGGIVLEGAVEDALRYAAPYVRTAGGGSGTEITLYDEPTSENPNRSLYMYARRDRMVRLTDTLPSGQRAHYVVYTPGNYSSLPDPSGGTFTADEDTLTGIDGVVGTVRVSGSLTFATMRVEAGDSLLFTRHPRHPSFDTSCPRDYSFPTDSTVVRTIRCGASEEREERSLGRIEGDSRSGTFIFTDEPDDPWYGPFEATTEYQIDGDVMTVTVKTETSRFRLWELMDFQKWYGTAAQPDHEFRLIYTLTRASPS